jgi:hypothetical protein
MADDLIRDLETLSIDKPALLPLNQNLFQRVIEKLEQHQQFNTFLHELNPRFKHDLARDLRIINSNLDLIRATNLLQEAVTQNTGVFDQSVLHKIHLGLLDRQLPSIYYSFFCLFLVLTPSELESCLFVFTPLGSLNNKSPH